MSTFRKTRNVFITMIFRVSGNVHDPHEPIVLDFGSTKLFKSIQEGIQNHIWEISFSKEYKSNKKRKTGKRREPENIDILLQESKQINMRSISSRRHEIEIWYLSSTKGIHTSHPPLEFQAFGHDDVLDPLGAPIRVWGPWLASLC